MRVVAFFDNIETGTSFAREMRLKFLGFAATGCKRTSRRSM